MLLATSQRLGQLLERDQRRRTRSAPRSRRTPRAATTPSDDRAERGGRAPALQARLDDAVDQHHLADRQRQRAGEVEARARRARGGARRRPRRRPARRRSPIGGLISSTQRQLSASVMIPPNSTPAAPPSPFIAAHSADRAVELRAGRERRGDDRQRATPPSARQRGPGRARATISICLARARRRRPARRARTAAARRRTCGAGRSGRRRGRRASGSRRT